MGRNGPLGQVYIYDDSDDADPRITSSLPEIIKSLSEIADKV